MLTKRKIFARYVYGQMHKGDRNWSTHEVARRAKAGGYTLSNGTVGNILNCRQKNIKEETLEALAYVFEVPKIEVFAAYYGEPGQAVATSPDTRQAALAEMAPQLTGENLAKYDALMEYVVHSVRQMIKEQGNGLPRGKGKKS